MLMVFDYCLQESESGGQTLGKNYWPHLLVCLCMLTSHMYIFLYLIGLILCMYLILYVCLLRFLLALNFVFSKIKMFKLLFILFVIKQLLGNSTSDIDTYSAKLSIIRLQGKLSGGNSDRNIAYLQRIIFCVYLSYFASTYFCKRQVFQNFEFLNFSHYKKTVESRDIQLMFLSRFTKKQAGHD